ncbi:hypothetical protein CPB83DRAFT_771440, partial [Crepidotus variabilis]
CAQCTRADPVWRCRECMQTHIFCNTCFFNVHQYSPFHRVECWNGSSFEDGQLWRVGVKLQTGHDGHIRKKTIGLLQP